MDVLKRAVGSLMALGAGLLIGRYVGNLWLIGLCLVVLVVLYVGLHVYERGHPPPAPPWAQVLQKQNEDLRTLVSSQVSSSAAVPLRTVEAKAHVLEMAVESDFAVGISAVKQRANWQVIHQWGPDIGPTPEPGVIVAVRSTDGEKLPIARCEVDSPDRKTLSYDFSGVEFYGDPKEALRQLKPSDFAAAFYPKAFTTEPPQLIDGLYAVRWFTASDGIAKEWIAAAFTMEGGKLIP